MSKITEYKGFISAYPGLKYAKDGVSVLVVLDGRRAKSNGLFPVKVQVVFKREQKFYQTGKDLSVNDWNELSETKSKILISVRNDMKNTFEKVEAAVKSLIHDDRFSFDALNLRLGKCATDTLNTAFTAKIEALKNDGAIGNMWLYQSAKRSVELFTGEKINFADITKTIRNAPDRRREKLCNVIYVRAMRYGADE